MAENRESVDGRRILKPSEVANGEQRPGDFAWEFDFTHFDHGAKATDPHLTLYFCLPGEIRWSPIHVVRGNPGGNRVWGWDGNLDKPTCLPSIHWVDHWHGWLRAGRFVSI
jgi:hypothetical protein